MNQTTHQNGAALAVTTSNNIEPQSLAELRALAKDAASSGFFGAASTEQAMMIMMAGKDMGFSYTQSLRAFHVIKGKPSLSADGMVAACLASPSCEYFRLVKQSDTSVTWETRRAGSEPVAQTFTLDDAARAGLINDMYKKYPQRMLSARCKSFLARDVYPEILLGLYDPDELRDAPASVVRAEVVRAVDDTEQATAFVDRINAATSLEALQDIAKDIKAAPLLDETKKVLKGIYADRTKAIKSGPASEPKAAEMGK